MMNTWSGKAEQAVSRRRAMPAMLAGVVLLAPSAHAAEEDFRYVVRAGDNPWNLTQRYLKGIEYWPRIQQYNRIEDPHAMPVGSILRMPVAWMRGQRAALRVADVHGSAELQREDGTVALVAGMTLTRGALIRTGEASSLLLEFPDGSRSLIGENAEARVVEVVRLKASAAQHVELELRRGRLENDVAAVRSGGGRYQIRTPAAVAAVRGTTFRVAASAAGARAETLAGEVVLSIRRGTVRVLAGTGSLAEPGRAPQATSPLADAPRLDALPTRVERLPFALPFPAVPGAQRYRTQLAPQGSLTPVSDRTAATPIAVGDAELADGDYRMRVRAIDARELEGHDAERDLVVDARPEPPFLNLPARDGVAVDERIEFRWTRSVEPGHYRFQLAADDAFATLLADREGLDKPGLVLDAGLPPGTYFWRVALTTAAEGRGPFSDVQRFRRPPPGPTAEAGEHDSRLELRWKSAGDDARYEVQLARDPSFAQPDVTAETRETVLAIETPPPGLYHVRVRTYTPDGVAEPWGKPQQLDVAPGRNWLPLLLLLPLLLFAL